ncbi:MAG: DUF493 domain-containing protein [Thermodesulfobacteriota bacterium]
MSEQYQENDLVTYPCRWLYKVITVDPERDGRRIGLLFQDCRCEISPSHRSSSGRYTSLNVEIEVVNRLHRDTVYGILRDLETVKVVL